MKHKIRSPTRRLDLSACDLPAKPAGRQGSELDSSYDLVCGLSVSTEDDGLSLNRFHAE